MVALEGVGHQLVDDQTYGSGLRVLYEDVVAMHPYCDGPDTAMEVGQSLAKRLDLGGKLDVLASRGVTEPLMHLGDHLYPPTIAALKRGEGEGGGFGTKDGIKHAGRNGKVLVWQRIITGFDPSRPSQKIINNFNCLWTKFFTSARHSRSTTAQSKSRGSIAQGPASNNAVRNSFILARLLSAFGNGIGPPFGNSCWFRFGEGRWKASRVERSSTSQNTN